MEDELDAALVDGSAYQRYGEQWYLESGCGGIAVGFGNAEGWMMSKTDVAKGDVVT
jgi:hypothetical protein